MKKDQIKTFPVIKAREKHFQTVRITQEINHLITLITKADHQNTEIHEISHKIDIVDQIVETISTETIIHDQIRTDKVHLIPVPTQTLGIDTFQMIDQEIHLTIDTEIILTIGIEVTQIVEINDIKTIDREIILTINQITRDLTTTTIKIDHEITHKKETQTITIDKETIPNHHIGIIHVITILKTNTEVTHQP